MEAPAPQRRATMPTGIVACLFTDIEGSTKLLQQLGDDFATVADHHHRILREAIAANDGYEVDTAGDGFFITFANASDAIATAVDAQRALASHTWPNGEVVRVRMGIHAGEVQTSGDAYIGLSVHQAARVMSAAHGGQILVSETARGLIERPIADLLELGAFELKDLSLPIRLYQVVAPDLAIDFPPLRANSSRGNNLPTIRTSFIDRPAESKSLRDAMATPGLVTLTGPGGCGKTRLAVETGRTMLDDYIGGVWFVDLRNATQASHVVEAIMDALSVPPSPDQLASIADRLSSDPAVLILDNCEHLVDACADACVELMDTCPELRIIATSRDLLGLDEERARRVPSLGLPTSDENDEVESSAAVRLFIERSTPHAADVNVDLATIARVVRRLDGIPLAIELAAARTRHISLKSLESGLDDMFRVLVGTERRSLQRQQTLQAVIDWSYELLKEDERAVLRRLSVFSGSFSLPAVEQICSGQPVCDGDTSDVLFRLLDRSLVERDASGDRYRLLETVRQYAQEKLKDADEAADVRDRHVAYFSDLVATAGRAMLEGDFYDGLQASDPDATNITAAVEWAISRQLPGVVSQMMRWTPWFYAITGREAELQEVVPRAISVARQGTTDERAYALAGWAISDLAFGSEEAWNAGQEAAALFEKSGTTAGEDFYLWSRLAAISGFGNEASALTAAQHLVTDAEKADHSVVATCARVSIAAALFRTDDLTGAQARMAEIVDDLSASTNPYLAFGAYFFAAMIAFAQRDHAEALRLYKIGLPLARTLPNKFHLQWTLDHASNACFMLGDLSAARTYAEEALAITKAADLRGGNLPGILLMIARIEHLTQRHAEAEWYLERVAELNEADERRPHDRIAGIALLADVRGFLGKRAESIAGLIEAFEIVLPLEPVVGDTGRTLAPPFHWPMEYAARLLGDEGRGEHAARLLGAARAWRDTTNAPMSGPAEEQHQLFVKALRDAMTDQEFEANWAEGAEADVRMVAAETLELLRALR